MRRVLSRRQIAQFRVTRSSTQVNSRDSVSDVRQQELRRTCQHPTMQAELTSIERHIIRIRDGDRSVMHSGFQPFAYKINTVKDGDALKSTWNSDRQQAVFTLCGRLEESLSPYGLYDAKEKVR